tara:strand:- start:1694 stop:1846 length:153 start_codon:yes stop_codon:yes gene_type:complete
MNDPALLDGFLAGATFLSFVGAALTKSQELKATWTMIFLLFLFAFYNSGN